MKINVFLTSINILITLILVNKVYLLQDFLKEKTNEEICYYLNSKDVIVKKNNCKLYDFKAYPKKYVHKENETIIIDITDKK